MKEGSKARKDVMPFDLCVGPTAYLHAVLEVIDD